MLTQTKAEELKNKPILISSAKYIPLFLGVLKFYKDKA